jgi:tryptophanyl-tRNA synthetase
LKKRYREGKVGDVEVKQKLAVAINNLLDPMRKRRAELENKPEEINRILRDGICKGREVSDEVLKKVKKSMKIDYIL